MTSRTRTRNGPCYRRRRARGYPRPSSSNVMSPASRKLEPPPAARFSGSRWAMIGDLIGVDPASVLDVGCRDQALKEALHADVHYVGLDLHEPADVLASAEEPLPFEPDSFDCVVLAD